MEVKNVIELEGRNAAYNKWSMIILCLISMLLMGIFVFIPISVDKITSRLDKLIEQTDPKKPQFAVIHGWYARMNGEEKGIDPGLRMVRVNRDGFLVPGDTHALIAGIGPDGKPRNVSLDGKGNLKCSKD